MNVNVSRNLESYDTIKAEGNLFFRGDSCRSGMVNASARIPQAVEIRDATSWDVGAAFSHRNLRPVRGVYLLPPDQCKVTTNLRRDPLERLSNDKQR